MGTHGNETAADAILSTWNRCNLSIAVPTYDTSQSSCVFTRLEQAAASPCQEPTTLLPPTTANPTTAAAGPVTTAAAGPVTTAAAGPVTTAAAGPVTTAAAGPITTAAAGPSRKENLLVPSAVRNTTSIIKAIEVANEAQTKKLTESIDVVRQSLEKYEITCKKQYTEVKTEVAELREDKKNMSRAIEQLETARRKNNLMIFDIPEVEGEKPEAVVRDICNQLNVTLGSSGISEAYRVGRQKGNRPIVCKITVFEKKMEIMRQNNANNRKFSIMPDITQTARDHRKALKPFQDIARKEGRHAFIRGDRIIIDGKSFTRDALCQSDNVAEAMETGENADAFPPLHEATGTKSVNSKTPQGGNARRADTLIPRHVAAGPSATVGATTRATTSGTPATYAKKAATPPLNIEKLKAAVTSQLNNKRKQQGNSAEPVKRLVLAEFMYGLEMEYDNIAYIVGGDFNARIGEESVLRGEVGEIHSDDNMEQPRRSRDKIYNAEGKKLLNFCENMGLRILNGTHGRDKQGHFTYIGENGASTIDFVLCSQNVLPLISDFNVAVRSESDHLPVVLQEALETVLERIKICDNEGDRMQLRQLQNEWTEHFKKVLGGQVELDTFFAVPDVRVIHELDSAFL
ncbi:hypothetical protein B566_EDAN018621, partial [Ephemera danica]